MEATWMAPGDPRLDPKNWSREELLRALEHTQKLLDERIADAEVFQRQRDEVTRALCDVANAKQNARLQAGELDNVEHVRECARNTAARWGFDDDLEILPDGPVTRGADDGFWVAARIWVRDEELPRRLPEGADSDEEE